MAGRKTKTELLIQETKHEQERVQKKTFTKWMNSYLCQCTGNLIINDLFIDIKDGLRLLLVLEKICGVTLAKENRKVMQKAHHLSNMQTALTFLEKKQVKLVNINAADIVEGKTSIVLGLIWTIIIHFEIGGESVLGTKQPAKKALLSWAESLVEGHPIHITDFTTSWRDGKAFNAMVHKLHPDLVDMDQVMKSDSRSNLERAFSAAEDHLGIARLLDVEDVDVDKPDERSIMTYITQFLKAYPDGKVGSIPKKQELKMSWDNNYDSLDNDVMISHHRMSSGNTNVDRFLETDIDEMIKSPEDNEQFDVENLKAFLKEAKSAIPPKNAAVVKLLEEYKKFNKLKKAQSEIQPSFLKLLENRKIRNLQGVSSDTVGAIQSDWKIVDDLLVAWQWRLDEKLPTGDLSRVAGWLKRAEGCLRLGWDDNENLMEYSERLGARLVEHKNIFGEYRQIQTTFNKTKSSKSSRIPAEQISDIGHRLLQVFEEEPPILRKLEHLELKYRIKAHFIIFEQKVAQWTQNLGRKSEVEALLEAYKKTIVNGGDCQEVSEAIDQFRSKSKIYATQELSRDPVEARELEDTITNMTEHWAVLVQKVRGAQSCLVETVKLWKSYDQSHDDLLNWLIKAEIVISEPTQTRNLFFSDLNNWVQRMASLKLIGKDLEDRCERVVAEEIQEKVESLARRLEILKKRIKEANQTEEEQNTQEKRKLYIGKVADHRNWMLEVQELVDTLQREDLSSTTYRAALNNFLQLIDEEPINQREMEALLKSFVSQEPPESADQFSSELQNLFHDLDSLNKVVETTSQKAPIMADCFDYKEKVSESERFLKSTTSTIEKQPSPDDLKTVMDILSQQESLVKTLNGRKYSVTTDVERGQKLLRNDMAASIVGAASKSLNTTWEGTNHIASERLVLLKQTANSWKTVDNCKETLSTVLRREETALGSSDPLESLESVIKEMQLFEERSKSLVKLQPVIGELSSSIQQLLVTVSPAKQAELQRELKSFQVQHRDLQSRVIQRLNNINDLKDQWEELHCGITDFRGFLTTKQTDIDDLNSKNLSPDKRVSHVNDIKSELENGSTVLQDLRKVGNNLISDTSKSIEAENIKSTLDQLEKRFDRLMQQLESESSKANDSLSKVSQYQAMDSELNSFFGLSQKLINSLNTKFDNISELKKLCREHEEFEMKKSEMKKSLDQLEDLAALLSGNPELQEQFRQSMFKWTTLEEDSAEAKKQLSQLKDKYHHYEMDLQNIVSVLEEVKKEIANCDDELPIQQKHDKMRSCLDKLKSYEKQISTLGDKLTEIEPWFSQSGCQQLRNSLKSCSDSRGRDSTLIVGKLEILSDILEAERVFSFQQNDFNKWLSKLDVILSNTRVIFSDQVLEVLGKLKVIQSEIQEKKSAADELSKQFEDLSSQVSKSELNDLEKLMGDSLTHFDKTKQAIELRHDVCEDWLAFEKDRRDWFYRVKPIQDQLKSTSLTDNDLQDIQKEISSLQRPLLAMQKRFENIEIKLKKAEMTIQHKNGKASSLSFDNGMNEINSFWKKITEMLQKQENVFEQVSEKWDTLQKLNSRVSNDYKVLETELGNASLISINPEAINELDTNLIDFDRRLKGTDICLKEMKKYTDEIIAADPTKALAVGEIVESAEYAFQELQHQLEKKKQRLQNVRMFSEQFKECLKDCETKKSKFDNDAQIKSTDVECLASIQLRIEEMKQLEQSIGNVASKSIEILNAKSQELTKEGKKFQGFKEQAVFESVSKCSHDWHALKTKIKEQKSFLEDQASSWNQIQSVQDELNSWLESTLVRLEESSSKVEDVSVTKKKLEKYQGDVSYYTELKSTMIRLQRELRETNKNLPSVILDTSIKEIEEKMRKAENISKQLSQRFGEFYGKKESLENSFKDFLSELNDLRDSIDTLDNNNDNYDTDIAEKMEKNKQLNEKLESRRADCQSLVAKTEDLCKTYPSSESEALRKEGKYCLRKIISFDELLKKMDSGLKRCLMQELEDARSTQMKWLKSAKDKMIWADSANEEEKASMDCKLSSIEELLSNLDEGERKTQEVVERMIVFKKAPALLGAIPNPNVVDEKSARNEFTSLVTGLKAIHGKLKSTSHQLKDYEQQESILFDWVKTTETLLRRIARNQEPSLGRKRELLEELKNIRKSTDSKKVQMDRLATEATTLSKAVANPKILTKSNENVVRFDQLSTQLNNLLKQCESNVMSHSTYQDKLSESIDWLKSVKQKLILCKDMPALDKESAEQKLAKLKELIHENNVGHKLFTETIPTAIEIIEPNTSPQGRDMIREELRSLRSDWDNYLEQMGDLQREIEADLNHWSTYDESLDQLTNWLSTLETAMAKDAELKATLTEKRSMLQNTRSRVQEVSGHQTMVESLADKAKRLSTATVMNNLDQIKTRFEFLEQVTKETASKWKQYVDNHELFQEKLQRANDLLVILNEKLKTCSIVPKDMNELESKIEKISALKKIIEETKNVIADVSKQGFIVLQETSAGGHHLVQSEITRMESNLSQVITELERLGDNYNKELATLSAYDREISSLLEWLKHYNSLWKDQDTKTLLQEKENKCEVISSCLSEITSKGKEFEEFRIQGEREIQKMDSKLAEKGQELLTNYQNLIQRIKNLEKVWKQSVKVHSELNETINSMKTQLEEMDTNLRNYSLRATSLNEIGQREAKVKLHHQQVIKCQEDFSSLVEFAEEVFPSTSSEGRDKIRGELRSLREFLDQLSEQMEDSQRQLDVCLYARQVFDEATDDLSKWMKVASSKLEEVNTPCKDLEERKNQIRRHNVFHQNLLSRQPYFESLADKANLIQDESAIDEANLLLVGFQRLLNSSQQDLKDKELGLLEHQNFFDQLSKFDQTLMSAGDCLKRSSDPVGDCLTLRQKLALVNELRDDVPEMEETVRSIMDLKHTIGQSLSPQGLSEVNDKMDHLSRSLNNHKSTILQTKANLEASLEKMTQFEKDQESLETWLSKNERDIVKVENKTTLKEKTARLNQLKTIKIDLDNKDVQFKNFHELVTSSEQFSQDTRITSRVSRILQRYEALKRTLVERLDKWNKVVANHSDFENNIQNLTEGLSKFEQQLALTKSKPLTSGADVEKGLTELQRYRREDIPLLTTQFQKTQQAGDIILPECTPEIRDKIRRKILTTKTRLDGLYEELAIAEGKNQQFGQALSSFVETQHDLDKWLEDTEHRLAEQPENNSLEDLEKTTLEILSITKDISMHRRFVDDAQEKTGSLRQVSEANETWSDWINNVTLRYQRLQTNGKEELERSQAELEDYRRYRKSQMKSKDWLQDLEERMTSIDDVIGDRAILLLRTDKIKELQDYFSEGNSKLANCQQRGERAMQACGETGRTQIVEELDLLESRWNRLKSSAVNLERNLSNNLIQLEDSDKLVSGVESWLKEHLRTVRTFNFVAGVEEKKDKLDDAMNLEKEIEDYQESFEEALTKISQIITTVRNEDPRTHLDKLTDQYNFLRTQAKNLTNRCDNDLQAHIDYQRNLQNYLDWFVDIKREADALEEVPSSPEELRLRLEKLQSTAQEKLEGSRMLDSAQDSGEAIYSSTSSEGRETIRQQLRQCRNNFEGIIETLETFQREVGMAVSQLNSFEDQRREMDDMLSRMMSIFGLTDMGESSVEFIFRETLEDKREQLQTFRNHMKELDANRNQLVSMREKVESLANSSDNSEELKLKLEHLEKHFDKIVVAAKQTVTKYEEIVMDHQNYTSKYRDVREMMRILRGQINDLCDVTGDRHAIQGRLNNLNSLLDSQVEVENQTEEVKTLAESTMQATNPRGCETIENELEDNENEWKETLSEKSICTKKLVQCLEAWNVYDKDFTESVEFVKSMEIQVREIDFKSTLPEKQVQIEKLSDMIAKTMKKEKDFENLLKQAELLRSTTGEKQVTGQMQGLSNRNQVIIHHLQDLIRRWKGHVEEHQTYVEEVSKLDDWLNKFEEKLEECSQNDGRTDRVAISEKSGIVHNLIDRRDDGFTQLDQLTKKMHAVFPHTSAVGRNVIREEVQDLQQTWDSCLALLNSNKSKLDSLLELWTIFEENEYFIDNWISEVEAQLEDECQPQDCLHDKKAHLERAKLLYLNVTGQETNIQQLTEKAQEISSMVESEEVKLKSNEVVRRFETLVESAKSFVARCELSFKNHNIYQEDLKDVSEFINSTKSKLTTTMDDRFDKDSTAIHLEKLNELWELQEQIEGTVEDVRKKSEIAGKSTSEKGLKIIHNEMSELEVDLISFKKKLKKQRSEIERRNEGWNNFEIELKKLCDWIKTSEQDLKAGIEPKSSVEEKQNILSRQRSKHEAILRQEDAFKKLNETADSLLEDSIDLSLTSKLAQTTVQYHNLIALSKELTKKLAEDVKDHAEYEKQFNTSQSWIYKILEKLKECQKPPKTPSEAQIKLNSLNDISIAHNEGLVYLKNTKAWSEKVKLTTSSSGIEIIKNKINFLVEQFAKLEDIPETKESLQEALTTLTEDKNNIDQIEQWIMAVDSRLNDSKPKDDLKEKMIQLQRARNLKGEISDKKKTIDHAAVRLKGSTESDFGNLMRKYEMVSKAAKRFVETSEENVQEHQRYQSALTGLSDWLSREQEELSECREPSGDIRLTENKLEKANNLTSEVSNGRIKLSDLIECADRVSPLSSDKGRQDIYEELTRIKHSVEDYIRDLASVTDNLARSLDLWDAFDNACRELIDCLRGYDESLRDSNREYRATVQEKKTDFENQKKQHAELMKDQKKLDAVTETGQNLIEMNCDPKISTEISQRTANYKGIISASQDLSKRLELCVANHSTFNELCEKFYAWAAENSKDMQRVNPRSTNKSGIDQLLNDIARIEHNLENGKAILAQAEESAKRTKKHSNSVGCQEIDTQLDTMRRSVCDVKVELTNCKRDGEKRSSSLEDCEQGIGSITKWLTETESHFAADKAITDGDISKKHDQLDRLERVVKEVNSKEADITQLQERSKGLNEHTLQSNANNVIKRYETLARDSNTAYNQLQKNVRDLDEYSRAMKAATDWLIQAKRQLTELSSNSGSSKDFENRLTTVKPLREEIDREGSFLVDSVVQSGDILLESVNGSKRQEIITAVKQIQTDFKELFQEVNELETHLVGLVGRYQIYSTDCDRFSEWIKDKELNLKKQVDFTGSYDTKIKQLNKCQIIFDEINNNKRELERLQNEAKNLFERIRDVEITKQASKLYSRYQALVVTCSKLREHMEKMATECNHFERAVTEAEAWIEETTQKLLRCVDYSGPHKNVQEKMEFCKDIKTSMNEGLNLVNVANDNGNNATNSSSLEVAERMRHRINDLNRDWAELDRQVTSADGNLEKWANRWSQYSGLLEVLGQWLQTAEKTTGQLSGGPIDVTKKQMIFDKLRALKREADTKDGQFATLQDLSEEIQGTGKNSSIAQESTGLKNRYKAVRFQIAQLLKLHDQVVQNQTDYKQALQECERWILAASFRIMSATPDSISAATSFESAREQSQIHAAHMEEIYEYRNNIDRLISLGQRVLDENRTSPDLIEQIQSQMTGINDSFFNLQRSADEIKIRLTEHLTKWLDYKEAIENGERFIHGDLFNWWIEKEKGFPQSSKDQFQDISEMRTMKQNLQALQREVTNCARKCHATSVENQSSGRSRTPVPPIYPPRQQHPLRSVSANSFNASLRGSTTEEGADDQESGLFRQATRFENEARDWLNKLKNRIDDMNELKVRWDKLIVQRDDLHDWLHHKQVEVREVTVRPSKLEIEPAKSDVMKLQELKTELEYMERDLQQLRTNHADLTNRRGTDEIIDVMFAEYADLLEHLTGHIEVREDLLREEETMVGQEHRGALQSSMSSAGSFNGLDKSLSTGTQTPCAHWTQTRGKSPTLRSSRSTESGNTRQIRNSGGNHGISKKFWPYTDAVASGKASPSRPKSSASGEDPIEGLRKALRELELDDGKASQRSSSSSRNWIPSRPHSQLGYSLNSNSSSRKSPSKAEAIEYLVQSINDDEPRSTNSPFRRPRTPKRSKGPLKATHTTVNNEDIGSSGLALDFDTGRQSPEFLAPVTRTVLNSSGPIRSRSPTKTGNHHHFGNSVPTRVRSVSRSREATPILSPAASGSPIWTSTGNIQYRLNGSHNNIASPHRVHRICQDVMLGSSSNSPAHHPVYKPQPHRARSPNGRGDNSLRLSLGSDTARTETGRNTTRRSMQYQD